MLVAMCENQLNGQGVSFLPNRFIDFYLQRLTFSQFKCLLAIYRLHPKKNITQFELKCYLGISSSQIKKAMCQLTKENLITRVTHKDENNGSLPSTYEPAKLDLKKIAEFLSEFDTHLDMPCPNRSSRPLC